MQRAIIVIISSTNKLVVVTCNCPLLLGLSGHCLGHVLECHGTMSEPHLLVEYIEGSIVFAAGLVAADGAELRGEHVEGAAEVEILLHGQGVLVVRQHVQQQLHDGQQRPQSKAPVEEQRRDEEEQTRIALIAENDVL